MSLIIWGDLFLKKKLSVADLGECGHGSATSCFFTVILIVNILFVRCQ